MSTIAWAVGAALIDFFWQGTVVAFAAGIALALLRGRSAQARYAVACLALTALVALPVLTALTFAASSPASSPAAPASPRDVGIVGRSSSDALRAATDVPRTMLPIAMVADSPQAAWLATAQAWAVPLWLAGVLLLSGRLIAASIRTFVMERKATAGDEDVRERVDAMARRLGLRQRVRVRVSPTVDGPGVIGWLKPMLLLPPSLALGLTPEQFEAILAHELAHVRRHDYAVSVLQSVAETLLFYHPAVWWVSRRIRIERELCCDDIVVRACGNPAAYARALTILARRQLGAPASVMPATGGQLAHRIRRLLGVSMPKTPRMSSAIVVAAVVAFVLVNLDWVRVRAQDAPDISEFIVASVKPHVPDDGRVMMSRQANGGQANGLTVLDLIRNGYQVQEFQVVGAPEWIRSDRYDIVATVDMEGVRRKWPAVTERNPLLLLMRPVLETRFGLRVHKETREMPVFALVFARSDRRLGPQLTRSPLDCSPGRATEHPADGAAAARRDPECNSGWIYPGGIRARGQTMARIAENFAMLTNTGSSLNRLVVDGTGLEGFYNMDLRFAPEVVPPAGLGIPDLPAIDPNAPAIFTAVQEQLGLKLEPRRGPAEVLVVDRIERPSPD